MGRYSDLVPFAVDETAVPICPSDVCHLYAVFLFSGIFVHTVQDTCGGIGCTDTGIEYVLVIERK